MIHPKTLGKHKRLGDRKLEIIAELCQNHNGSRTNLLEMAKLAKRAGASYAKIQALYSKELVYRAQFENPNIYRFGMYRPFKAEMARLQKLDLSLEDEKSFVNYCLEIGIEPMITVFTKSGVERAFEAGFKKIKIASYDSTNLDLIDSVLGFATDLFISTGATTTKEVEFLCRFLSGSSSECNISLLHCKTEYPNILTSVNLNRMIWLETFGFRVGFSDHTATFNSDGDRIPLRNLPSKMAIYLGASVLERHFTNLNPTETKDGKISVLEDDLIELKNFSELNKVQQTEYLMKYTDEKNSILGSKDYEPSVEEWWNRSYYRGRVE